VPDEPSDLDGCDLDFAQEDQVTEDGEQVAALAMFADVWDDPDAVDQRRRDLISIDLPQADDVPTTGAPDA
jgi:hypothetical protein